MAAAHQAFGAVHAAGHELRSGVSLGLGIGVFLGISLVCCLIVGLTLCLNIFREAGKDADLDELIGKLFKSKFLERIWGWLLAKDY